MNRVSITEQRDNFKEPNICGSDGIKGQEKQE